MLPYVLFKDLVFALMYSGILKFDIVVVIYNDGRCDLLIHRV